MRPDYRGARRRVAGRMWRADGAASAGSPARREAAHECQRFFERRALERGPEAWMSTGRKIRKSRGTGGTLEPQGKPRVSRARLVAFEILRRVEEEGAFASVLLAADEDGLLREDRALAYEI